MAEACIRAAEQEDQTGQRAGGAEEGLDIDDAHLTLLYRLPYNTLNPEVEANYASNQFSVTRQVHFSAADPMKSVDMVLFVNGLAIATLELKNPWTGQNVQHAIKQYRTDRSPQEPLFEFGRCLVHFAVDPDEAYMCAQLAGNDSNFLPFNKGNNFGRGNPVNLSGHKTAYLWQEILQRRSLSNIIEQFAADRREGKEDRQGDQDSDLPALSPARRGAHAIGQIPPGRTWQYLPDPTLGRLW